MYLPFSECVIINVPRVYLAPSFTLCLFSRSPLHCSCSLFCTLLLWFAFKFPCFYVPLFLHLSYSLTLLSQITNVVLPLLSRTLFVGIWATDHVLLVVVTNASCFVSIFISPVERALFLRITDYKSTISNYGTSILSTSQPSAWVFLFSRPFEELPVIHQKRYWRLTQR